MVSDYKTGEILCMVSTPSYDPQNPPVSVEGSEYEGVYINRCISSVYTPGSVFKPVTLAAALETPDMTANRKFFCSGVLDLDGDAVTCPSAHGEQDIRRVFANSCNCAFAELSLELGAETIREYAEAYGFLSAHKLDGITTAAGGFDMPETAAETAWAGIGQYNDLVSPFSLLRFVSATANGGLLKEPHILQGKAYEKKAGSRLIKADTASELKEMMRYNVTDSYGVWNFPDHAVCAKTGTAEVGDGTSHAWITGFIDDEEYPFAFTVIVENGGGGLAVAAPVASAVLRAACH